MVAGSNLRLQDVFDLFETQLPRWRHPSSSEPVHALFLSHCRDDGMMTHHKPIIGHGRPFAAPRTTIWTPLPRMRSRLRGTTARISSGSKRPTTPSNHLVTYGTRPADSHHSPASFIYYALTTAKTHTFTRSHVHPSIPGTMPERTPSPRAPDPSCLLEFPNEFTQQNPD